MRKKKAPPNEEPSYAYKGPLRTAKGEMPCGSPCHNHFYLRQGELYYSPKYPARWAGIEWSIGVLPLNNGNWLARPLSTLRKKAAKALGFAPLEYYVGGIQFETRDTALRAAVAAVVRLARYRYRHVEDNHYGMYRDWKLTREQAQAHIDWAYSLLGLPAPQLFVPRPKPAPITSEAIESAVRDVEGWLGSPEGHAWARRAVQAV